MYAQSVNAVDRAYRMMDIMINTNEENPNLANVEVKRCIRDEKLFESYWARKPGKGHTLGKNFIETLKEDIQQMVLKGCVDKS